MEKTRFETQITTIVARRELSAGGGCPAEFIISKDGKTYFTIDQYGNHYLRGDIFACPDNSGSLQDLCSLLIPVSE